ncbi:MAG TPA: FecR family protein [Chthoniobacterales bacterium]|nr:FecR family protein [Chthoniobacterales bacterium]
MRRFSAVALALGVLCAQRGSAQTPAATVVSTDNIVEVAPGAGAWSTAAPGQLLNERDRLRTGEESRAIVRLGDGSVLHLDELTTIEIKPARAAGSTQTLSLPAGAAYFLNRAGTREVLLDTPSANGAIRGTAFLLKVDPITGQTTVSMMEGAFELENAGGRVVARRGEEAATAPMAAPAKDLLTEFGHAAPWYLVIEHDLPSLKTLRRAERGEFFGALPEAIKEWRHVSPQLAGSATIVRTEWARDILRASFKAVGPDCPLLAKILRSVIAAAPADANGLTELAVKLWPQCADAFKLDPGAGGDGQGFDGGGPPANPGSVPAFSGAGRAQSNLVSICHNGRTIFVSPAGAQAHLNNHPGDTLGACQVTPTQNQ